MQIRSNFVCAAQSTIISVEGASLGRDVGMEAVVKKFVLKFCHAECDIAVIPDYLYNGLRAPIWKHIVTDIHV